MKQIVAFVAHARTNGREGKDGSATRRRERGHSVRSHSRILSLSCRGTGPRCGTRGRDVRTRRSRLWEPLVSRISRHVPGNVLRAPAPCPPPFGHRLRSSNATWGWCSRGRCPTRRRWRSRWDRVFTPHHRSARRRIARRERIAELTFVDEQRRFFSMRYPFTRYPPTHLSATTPWPNLTWRNLAWCDSARPSQVSPTSANERDLLFRLRTHVSVNICDVRIRKYDVKRRTNISRVMTNSTVLRARLADRPERERERDYGNQSKTFQRI